MGSRMRLVVFLFGFTTLPSMKYSPKTLEEELKNKVAKDFFGKFDCTGIIKKIDFSVKIKKTEQYVLWAEAKKNSTDIIAMLAQLVLTIGKARTFNDVLPPRFLGCFDCEKIVFVPYAEIQDIFYQSDFNWNVAASDYESREFRQIYAQLYKIINSDVPWKTYRFDFEKDEKALKLFILKNFMPGNSEIAKTKIDRNNFLSVYYRWLEAVKPTITLHNWEKTKKAGIIDGDFYLADLLSSENQTLKEKLFVVLKTNKYIMNRHENEMGLLTSTEVDFNDSQKAHAQFWALYERPPREDYWDYIIERRDLLVPQDVRERKGSFFTPKIWVELSQKYIADVFGEDWQDKYYVWDCAAGTGNLLAGLTNKYNIWASTLDKADVDVMHDRIKNGANLLEEHCFQFDFLNDDFDKLPDDLREIIKNTPEKLLVYINPPYAETATKDTVNKDRINKRGVSFTKIQEKYADEIGIATKELFAQFLARLYKECQLCKIANFAKLKALCAPNFAGLREMFQARLEKLFVVPANTFDNVDGQFPIGFHIWDTDKKEKFAEIAADVFDKDAKMIGNKTFWAYDKSVFITDWYRKYHTRIINDRNIGALGIYGSDFQHNNFIRITNCNEHPNRYTFITSNNLIETSIYLAVRHCIEADWLNDRDQFLYPNDKWENDLEFQSDCLAYVLFHNSNNISSKHGINHWLPFTESEVNSRNKFKSNFMTDFIKGKVKTEKSERGLFNHPCPSKGEEFVPLEFSAEAKAVFDAGRELWRYYHSFPSSGGAGVVVNASFYDIREHFQGRNPAGRMNSKSEDAKYNELIGNLREKLKILAKKIEPKVYGYGFLR